MPVRFWPGQLLTSLTIRRPRDGRDMKLVIRIRRWIAGLFDPKERAVRRERKEAQRMAKFLERNEQKNSKKR